MRPLGLTGAPSLILDAGSGAQLRAGVSISVSVLESLSPGFYRILVGGQVLTARSEVALAPGSILRAKVEAATPGEGLVLRLEVGPQRGGSPASGLDIILAKAGLPSDPAGRLAVAALLSEGLVPSQASLARVRRVALGHGGESQADSADDEGSLFAARMEAKGLGASLEAVDELLSAGDGWQGRGQGSGQGKGKDESGGQGPDGGSDAPGPPTDPRPPVEARLPQEATAGPAIPEEDLPRVLGAFLQGLCTASSDGDRPGKGVLGLFNHARAASGGWIVVPFRFALDSVAFAGNFRILLPYIPGGPGRIEGRFQTSLGGLAAFDAKVPNPSLSSWGFDLAFGSGRPRLVVLDREGRPGMAGLVSGFAAELAASGCDVVFAEKGCREESRGIDVDA